MKTLTTTFFSTLEQEQISDCLKNLLSPWKWRHFKNGKFIKEAENTLKQYLGLKYCLSFYNGRTALVYALKSAGVKPGDEVIVQAYTCVSVPRAVMDAGAKTVYCDVDESLNLDPEELKKKITANTKAVIVQHTFGNPARIEDIREVCDNGCDKKENDDHGRITSPPPLEKGRMTRKIFLLEDCAHALGAKYKGKLVGTFGDISIFSSGRDKVISSINGGMLCTDNAHLFEQVEKRHAQLPWPSFTLIIRNLLYPIIAICALKCYNKLSLGKALMYFSKKLKIFPLVLTKEEKGLENSSCARMPYFRMPNILAYSFFGQFAKLDRYNRHRKEIAAYYLENLRNLKFPRVWEGSDPIFLRFTVLMDEAEKMFAQARKSNIYLGGWYRNTIDPKGVNLTKIGYEQNMCPKAEEYATMSINLPNHSGITEEDSERVCNVIKSVKL